jgi:hypothetical protein
LFLFGCGEVQKKDNHNIVVSKDSLNYFFDKANNDSLSYSLRLKYNNSALSLISKNKNDSLNRVNFFKVANRFFNMNNLDDYKKTTWKIIENSKKENDTLSLIKAYNYLIEYYIQNKNPDSTYYYNYEGEKLYRKLNDHLNIAKLLLNKAILQHNASDFLGAEKTVFEILKNLRFEMNNALLYESYNLLGIIYAELAEYKLSKKYYDLAILVSENPELISEYQLRAVTLNNIGVLFRYQEKNNVSIDSF